ncbi:MAG TPA: cytochrome c [Actinobacteria bacterium]|nr:cytochrome c [Actinomycetota bacterium]
MKNYESLIAAVILMIVGAAGLLALNCSGGVFDGPDGSSSYSSLGQRIYFFGRGENNRLISYRNGPQWLQMHGGSCVSCHGEDGEGEIPLMMTDQQAPSIKWKALTEEDHNEHEGEEKHALYTQETIKRAITKGLDPAGQELDLAMPIWEMNKKELNALIGFLKKLD